MLPACGACSARTARSQSSPTASSAGARAARARLRARARPPAPRARRLARAARRAHDTLLFVARGSGRLDDGSLDGRAAVLLPAGEDGTLTAAPGGLACVRATLGAATDLHAPMGPLEPRRRARARRARPGDRRALVPAPARPAQRLDARDALRRLHPAWPGAVALPPLRRDRLDPERHGQAPPRRRGRGARAGLRVPPPPAGGAHRRERRDRRRAGRARRLHAGRQPLRRVPDRRRRRDLRDLGIAGPCPTASPASSPRTGSRRRSSPSSSSMPSCSGWRPTTGSRIASATTLGVVNDVCLGIFVVELAAPDRRVRPPSVGLLPRRLERLRLRRHRDRVRPGHPRVVDAAAARAARARRAHRAALPRPPRPARRASGGASRRSSRSPSRPGCSSSSTGWSAGRSSRTSSPTTGGTSAGRCSRSS